MKVVLAIDPFEKEIDVNSLSFADLKLWSAAEEIYPVYISEQPADLSTALPVIVKSFAPFKVLTCPSQNRKIQIEALLKYAHEIGAELIAVASHGKANLEKKLLGSFAETLVLRSDLPILFLRDSDQLEPKANKVLFATDFSQASQQAFGIFLEQIKSQQPEVILHHAIPVPQFVTAGPVYAHALNLLPQSYWEEQRVSSENAALVFIKQAMSMKVQVRLVISNQVLSIESSIREIVKSEKIRLVAMASVSKPLQRFLLGSVSRSVLRDKIRPMWICGSQALDSQEDKDENN